MASQYATPGGVDPAAVMAGIVANRNNAPSHYATPGGVDPGAVMRGIVQQFAQQQAQQQAAPVPPTNYNGSLYATPGGVNPGQVMAGIVSNMNNSPSHYATPGGVDPGAVMRGIVQQFALQQAQQQQAPRPPTNYNGSLYWNPQSGLPDPLTTMANIVKNRAGAGAPPPTNLPISAGGPGNGVQYTRPSAMRVYSQSPTAPPAPYYQPPKLFPTGPQGPPQQPMTGTAWTPQLIAGLGRRMSDGGGLRRRRYAEGGEVTTNAQGGMTAEAEAEFIARQMASANFQPSPEVNPTPEQQAQQVADNMAAALRSQNTELWNQDNDQRAMLDSLGTTERYGAGPPYTASVKEYSGPPPMEAQPDWNYDSGAPSDWHDFNSNNTTTGGGFFNMDEIFHRQGKAVPNTFQSGSNLPSTNNYRLLPPDFRKPNYIMRNGQIIDMNSLSMHGPFGPDRMNEAMPDWRSGANTPVAWASGPVAYSLAGWPGQLGSFSSPTGFMGLGGAG